MSVLHNVVRGAQDGTSPARWQSCLGRFPSPLETTKMAFRRLWHAIEVPHTPSSATQSRGRPSARASVRPSEVLAGYPLATTARVQPWPWAGQGRQSPVGCPPQFPVMQVATQ